ncbi:hypothetical protein CYMTET_46355, partial [Cymbomonas tetramitiformis]
MHLGEEAKARNTWVIFRMWVRDITALTNATYIVTMVRIFEVMDCKDLDGVLYVEAAPHIECQHDNTSYRHMLDAAIMFLMLWGVVVPVAKACSTFYGFRHKLLSQSHYQ